MDSNDSCPLTDNSFYSMERFPLKYNFVPKTSAIIDTKPIAGKLTNFPPVAVELISGSDLEPLWDRLVSSLMVDSSKIRRDLDWKAPFSMDQGLRETAEWYKKEGRSQESEVRCRWRKTENK